MKKLLYIFLLCLILTTSATGQFFAPQQKPMLGLQVNNAHQLGDGVGYWFFNEGSGNKVFDLSGNGNTGAFVGNTHWFPGKFGSSLKFDGTGDYATVGTTGMIKSQGTILLWTRFLGVGENVDDEVFFFHRTGSDNNRIYLDRRRSDSNHFWIALGNSPTEDTNQVLNDNVWYHLGLTWSGANYIAYLDGRNVKSGTTSEPTSINTTANIGGSSAYAICANCLIDNAIIYNRALSQSEIALLYREPFCFMDGGMSVAQMYSYGAPPAVVVTPYYYRSAIPILIVPFGFYCYLRRRKCAA